MNFIKALKTVFSSSVVDNGSLNSFMNAGGDKRYKMMNVSMDKLIEYIKSEKTKQPLLNRTVNNIIKDTLKGDYIFQSVVGNETKSKLVKAKFEEILYNSALEPRAYLREVLTNIVSYSNNFTVPFFDEEMKLRMILNLCNKGWTVKEKLCSVPVKWEFKTSEQESSYFDSGSISKTFNSKDVWHYTFNKESDEVFGMPLWASVIPLLNKYNHLLDDSIDSYSDQAIKKNIYIVGGSSKAASKGYTSPEDYATVYKELSQNIDDDLITNVPIEVKTIEKTYTSPDKLLETLEFQIIAGLHSSRSQLGESGAGRQDADTQKENTLNIIEDFQENLEDFINRTFIRKICIDLFNNYNEENVVKFKFEKTFNSVERTEKHAAFLFQAGLIDLDEARDRSYITGEIQNKKTFNELYGKSEINGSVQAKNSPVNQHTKPGGTGTTKPTKKN